MVTKTEAAVLFKTGEPLRIMELTLPPLKPGQVLVEIAFSGVCHTQLGEARGRRGPDPYLPHTLGHEGSGTVIDVGEGVTKVRPGDKVVLSWIRGKGMEQASTVYHGEEGPVNSGAISTFMRHAITCENRLTPLPDTMPLREAALLGCAIPTGCGIILNKAHVHSGQSVAVFGVGGVGLSAVLGAAMVGASPIIAVDRIEEKLKKALQLGATHTVNGTVTDPREKILEITQNRGVDLAIEAAGVAKAMEAAFGSIRPFGGLCVIAGNLKPGESIHLDPFDLIRGKRIEGTWGGETDPDRDIPRYIQYYSNQRLRLGELITGSYSLGEVNLALDDLEKGKAVRSMIDMSLG